MKHFAAIFLVILTTITVQSQTYEVGALLGGSNYIGDVGKTNYLSPNDFAIGGIFKWNRSSRHSFRGSLMLANINADDRDSDETRRIERGYKFENTIIELSIGIEYTFWEFSMYDGQPADAPYLYTGLTYFRYNSLSKRITDDVIVEISKNGSIAIPMVVGYKARIGTKFILAGEIGARYTFTDNLDGSNPSADVLPRFGNINSDDWYVFTGVTLTFTWGRRPCYCNF